jgi:hypothetical protein
VTSDEFDASEDRHPACLVRRASCLSNESCHFSRHPSLFVKIELHMHILPRDLFAWKIGVSLVLNGAHPASCDNTTGWKPVCRDSLEGYLP